MACKTEKTEIDGTEYTVTQWAADTAFINKFRLIEMFGTALSKLAPLAAKGVKKDAELDIIGDVIAALFENKNPEECYRLIKNFIVGTVFCGGERIDNAKFVEKFSGDNMMTVYKVFFFVVRVNYGNFIKGRLGEALMAKIPNL